MNFTTYKSHRYSWIRAFQRERESRKWQQTSRRREELCARTRGLWFLRDGVRHQRLEEGKAIEHWKGRGTQDPLKEESVWKLHGSSVFTKKEFRKASEALFTLERGEKRNIYGSNECLWGKESPPIAGAKVRCKSDKLKYSVKLNEGRSGI